jgi:hypothetical protein
MAGATLAVALASSFVLLDELAGRDGGSTSFSQASSSAGESGCTGSQDEAAASS